MVARTSRPRTGPEAEAAPSIPIAGGSTIAERLRMVWKSADRKRGAQTGLARAMKVSTAHLSSILSGRNDRRNPCSPESGKRAAEHLRVDARWLVVGDARSAPELVADKLKDTTRMLRILVRVADAIEPEDKPLVSVSTHRSRAPVAPASQVYEDGDDELYRFGVPHPDVSATGWLRAMRWLRSMGKLKDLEPDRRSWAKWFTSTYNETLSRLAVPLTVTLPGHAWVAVQKATWRAYPIQIGGQQSRLAREMSQIPSLRQDEFE